MKCGKIVNESKHNLSRYKTAVSHCFKTYRVDHADEIFAHAKVEAYSMTCKHYFDSIKKQENEGSGSSGSRSHRLMDEGSHSIL